VRAVPNAIIGICTPGATVTFGMAVAASVANIRKLRREKKRMGSNLDVTVTLCT
jgi:hypothetical protein